MDTIWIPRAMVNEIIRNSQQPKDKQLLNVQLCVKIPYRGFEISVACDSSHGTGDLRRSEIRIFSASSLKSFSEDVTAKLFRGTECETEALNSCVYGYGESLYLAFKQIDNYLNQQNVVIVSAGAGARGYDPAGG